METDLENNLIQISQMKTTFDNIAETIEWIQVKAECRAEVDDKLNNVHKITNSITFKQDITRLNASVENTEKEIYKLVSFFTAGMIQNFQSYDSSIYKLRRDRAHLMIELEKIRQETQRIQECKDHSDISVLDDATSFDYDAWKTMHHGYPRTDKGLQRVHQQHFNLPGRMETGLKKRLSAIDDEERELVSSTKAKIEKSSIQFNKRIVELHTIRARSLVASKRLNEERRKLNHVVDEAKVGGDLDHYSSFDDNAWRNMHHGTNYEF